MVSHWEWLFNFTSYKGLSGRRSIIPSATRCVLIASLVIICGPPILRGQQTSTSVASIESLVRSHQYDQALDATMLGLREAPGNFRLLTLQGIIFSMKGNNSRALTAFDEALRLAPTYTPALKGEVQLLYESRDKRAIPLLQRILAVDPQDQTAHEMLAMLEKLQGDCKSANSQFLLTEEPIATRPESLEAYGYCLVQVKEFEKAISVFERLVSLLPDSAYPKYDLAVILVTMKQNEAAIKLLEPLLADDQRDTDILSLASEAYEANGNTPKAVALLRQAIVLNPTTSGYYVSFAVICMDHDSFQVGIDMMNAGLQRIPDASSLYLSRGLLYAQLAEYDKAEADFNSVEKLDSQQSLASYAVDLADLQRNNPEKALVRVRSQLKAHADSAELHLLLAELLMNQTPVADSIQFKEAMKSAQLALKLKPDMVGARDLLASIYMHSGQYNLAIGECRQALQLSPSDEAAAYHLMIALRHTGQSGTDEMKTLVKRLSQMHQQSMKKETDRKRYRLVVQQPPPAK